MSAESSASHAGRRWWPFAALALLVVATTGARFDNGFVYDDEHVIEDGTVIHDPSQLGAVWTSRTMFASSADDGVVASVDTYRPVPITLFMWDAWVSGHAPWSYHLTNLLLHLGCTWLVFVLGLRLLGARHRLPVLYGAAVFAVHPWSVEAHVWINGRSDPAALLCLLAAALAMLRAERVDHQWRRLRWRALAFAVAMLSLLSKETALLPLVALPLLPSEKDGTTVWPQRALVWRRAVALLPAAVVYLVVRTSVLGGVQTHRDGSMVADAAVRGPVLLLDAARELLAPTAPHLRSMRDDYLDIALPHALVAGVLLLALLGLAWRFRRQAPTTLFGLFFIALPLVPVAVITTVLWPGFGRYLYLPAAGFAWVVADLARCVLARPSSSRRLLAALACVHVGLLGVLAFSFTRDFQSTDTLYGAAVEIDPDSAMARGFWGMSLLNHGEPTRAAPLLLEASELDPSTHRYLAKAGIALLESGDRAGATATATEGIERFAGGPEEAVFHMTAVGAMQTRSPGLAVGHLVRCLEVWPGRPDCAAGLRTLLRTAPDRAENRAALRRLLNTRPELEAVLQND